MKKFGGMLIIAGLLVAAVSFAHPVRAYAAACANVSTFGAVNLVLPELPHTGEFALWVRMQSPTTSGKVLAEVNQADCIEVASSQLQSNVWAWQAYSQDGHTKPMSFAHSEGNIIKVIGTQAGLKIDRVLLTEPDCIPEEFGNNCASSVEAVNATTDGVIVLPPPSEESVSGEVVLSNTPFTYQEELASVSYAAGGRTMQSSSTAKPFDTTRLENGKYTVLIETKLQTGKIIKESTVITIDNPQSVLSPAVRWIRQHQQSLTAAGLIIGGVVLVIVGFFIIRKLYISRRERHFHGF